MTVKRPRVVAVRLSEGEFQAFVAICEKNSLRYQEMMRAIIIDALLEEGYDALRSREQERREGCSESSESCGAAT